MFHGECRIMRPAAMPSGVIDLLADPLVPSSAKGVHSPRDAMLAPT
jgi:hypothetical protein